MKPFEKIYAFSFMTIIHPSGHTDKITIEQLEKQVKANDALVKQLKIERAKDMTDIAKISSKSRIKRAIIKYRLKRDSKEHHDPFNP